MVAKKQFCLEVKYRRRDPFCTVQSGSSSSTSSSLAPMPRWLKRSNPENECSHPRVALGKYPAAHRGGAQKSEVSRRGSGR